MIQSIENIKYSDFSKFGNKSKGIFMLKNADIVVPNSVVVSEEHSISKKDVDDIFSILDTEIVIVRSSSNIEDSLEKSFAGVFQSKTANKETLIEAIDNIRLYAKKQSKLLLNLDISDIPILIQPFLQGIGGVYLSNEDNSWENLEISKSGVSDITEGTVNNENLLSKDSEIYKQTMAKCREAQKKLMTSVDFEFVIIEDLVIFLQYRELTLSARNQIDNYSTPSEYFPYPIRALCATIWIMNLSKILDIQFIYQNSQVEYYPNSIIEESNLEVGEIELDKAISYYTNVLFPKWDNDIAVIESLVDTPENKFKTVYIYWCNFIKEYFLNEFEYVIDYARNNTKEGASISPQLCSWLNDITDLNFSLTNDFSNNYPIEEFLKKHGKAILPNSNYFQNPSIEEIYHNDGIVGLKPIVKNIHSIEKYLPNKNPTQLLKASWLAEDDNNYKNIFSYHLRKSIIELGLLWEAENWIDKSDDIWDLEISDLISFLENKKNPIKLFRQDFLKPIPKSSLESFNAEILSNIGFTINGFIINDSKNVENLSDKILLKKHIDVWDYPILLNCLGAIIDVGSYNSHAAIFSRDIGKPLFKSTSAFQNLQEGFCVELNHSTKKISILT